MSPSKIKSKDKKSGKEPQKATSKPPVAASSIPASAYNPLSGTFHALEVIQTSSASPNGRFRNIDETDDHLVGLEYDSASNNGSWSGESEDHKEKASSLPLRNETIPGGDNDKREKIRQQNEKKHQRQKERRAQELHERCNGYLMSRKLEALAQQLVSMGFPHERATMALMFNDGKVEESVSWLLEGGEDADSNLTQGFGGGNLKLDISEELTRMTDMERRYKCTRQEVERAIINSEGDLQKAAESLRDLKLEPPTAPPKLEETGDPPVTSNPKSPVGVIQNVVRRQQQLQQQPQPKPNPGSNYTKAAVPNPASLESSSKNLQPLNKIQPKLEWGKPQQNNTLPTDKRWPGSNSPFTYSLASPLQVSPPLAKTEPGFMASGSDYKSLHLGTVREPVIMMQRPQSASTKQVATTSLNSSLGSWYPASNIPTTRSLGPINLNSNQTVHQLHYPARTGASPTLAAASSLGLFCGLGGSTCSSGPSSPVDWSTAGSSAPLDYTNIDWSLDRGLSSPSPGGLWMGRSLRNGTEMYNSSSSGFGARIRSGVNGIPGLQDGGVSTETGAAGSPEWTSPFEGTDFFTLPRQFVSSPSL